MNILVVEDEPVVAMDIEGILESAGARIFYASGTQQALDIARRQPVDLALLDLRLQFGDSGLALAELLLEHHSIPSIFVTANAQALDYASSFALGVLPKPFTPLELLATVRAVREILRGEQPSSVPPRLRLYSDGRVLEGAAAPQQSIGL
jgi:DNA-binding response OmpR family regulator